MNFASVCKDCTDRHIGCHGYCERYIEAKVQHEKERKRIRQIKDFEADARDFKYTNTKKALRNKGVKA